jgi:hypothetical protein
MDKGGRRSVWLGVWLAYFLFVTAPSAHAYIDPGNGSFVFQMFVGGLLAAGVAFWSYLRRLWSLLFGRGPRDQTPVQAD